MKTTTIRFLTTFPGVFWWSSKSRKSVGSKLSGRATSATWSWRFCRAGCAATASRTRPLPTSVDQDQSCGYTCASLTREPEANLNDFIRGRRYDCWMLVPSVPLCSGPDAMWTQDRRHAGPNRIHYQVVEWKQPCYLHKSPCGKSISEAYSKYFPRTEGVQYKLHVQNLLDHTCV